MSDGNIIDIADYRGERVILSKGKWKEKQKFHPELRNKTFLKNLERTIENPEEVWQDYHLPKKKRCYYRRYGVNLYVKVVIWARSTPCNIVSAFITNYIRETKYNHLKRLK